MMTLSICGGKLFYWDAMTVNGMHYAPVCGVQIYEQMAIRGKLPSYHLLLAHDIINRPERYNAVFGEGRGGHIILDNSLTELGTSVDLNTITFAANAVQANVIVLPDVYTHGPETIKACRDAYHEWLPLLNGRLNYGDWSFMLVPQGRNLKEYAVCAEAFPPDDYPKIKWWGIPRNQVAISGSRALPVEICKALAPNRSIHMLGFSDNIIDDWHVCRQYHSIISGIDSAVPVRVDAPFSLGLEKLQPRTAGWLENAEYTQFMQDNIDAAQRLFVGS